MPPTSPTRSPEHVRLLVMDVDGVLTDGSILLDAEGREVKRFHVRDGLGIALWRRMGFEAAVVTGRGGAALEHRLAELGIAVGVQRAGDKGAAIDEVSARSGVPPEQMAYLGDDLPDLPAMRRVAYPMAVADADARVIAAAAHVTRAPGGRGAVREAVEHLLGARGLLERAAGLYDGGVMPTPRTRGAARATGLLTAAALAALGFAVVGWFVVRGRGEGGPPALEGGAPPVPDTDRLLAAPPTDLAASVVGAEGVRIPFMDRNDPTRVAGEISAARMDPLEARRYALEKPSAWIFRADGSALHAEADRARLHLPAREQAPESGVLEGNVVLRVFDPGVVSHDQRVDPHTAPAAIVARLDSLTFDAAVGSASSPDFVEVRTPDATISGRGLDARYSELTDRLELLQGFEDGRLEMHAAPAAPRSTTPRQDEAGAGEPPDAAPPGPGAQPGEAEPAPIAPLPAPEALYKAVFRDNVGVRQGERLARADRLEVWARTIGGRLPEGAIADVLVAPEGGQGSAPAGAPGANAEVAGAGEAGAPGGEPGAGAPASPQAEAVGQGNVVLTWSGPLLVTPLEHAPEELRDDHVSLRLTGDRSGRVEFEDPGTRSRALAASADYGLTSRRLVLAGPGPSNVELFRPGQEVVCARLEMDLGTGLIRIPGAGVAREVGGDATEPDAATDSPGAAPAAGRAGARQIAWNDRGEFQLVVDETGLTERLSHAEFHGRVSASDAEQSFSGDSLRAEFDTALDEPALSLVRVEGDAVAEGGQRQYLAGDWIEVGFDTSSGEAVPDAVRARGRVTARREGETLSADRLDAALAPDADGVLGVTRATAGGRVRYEHRDQEILAGAEEMAADAGARTVDLVGAGSYVALGGTRIEGGQIHLDGERQVVRTFGAGRFTHVPGPDGAAQRVTAEWTEYMSFDDRAGRIECQGSVRALSVADEWNEDRLESGRLVVELQPRSESDDALPGESLLPLGRAGGERAILRSTAYGEREEFGSGGPARAESWSFRAGPDGAREVEQVLAIDGPRLELDHAAMRLVVPGAGRLLVEDRREDCEDPDAATEPALGEQPGTPRGLLGSDTRGRTLFTWQDGLSMEQASGLIDMTGGVTMLHRGLGDAPLEELECDRLTAAVRWTEPPGASVRSARGELLSADASGAVRLKIGPKELTADRLHYDAAGGLVHAAADPGHDVTFIDLTQGAPVTARSLTWNLRTDRIDIESPGTAVIPR